MTATPRILFYTDSSSLGGAEASLGALLSELDRSFEVVISGVQPAVVEWLSSVRPDAPSTIVRAVRGKQDIAGFIANLRHIRAVSPQIFHANLSVPSACQYALAAATLVPGVRTVAVEQLPYPLHGALQRQLKRYTSRRLSAHVAVGDEVARQLAQFTGLARESLRTIHNGVPDAAPLPIPRLFEGPTIGAVGRLDRQKGYDVLLAAMADLPDAALVLVGDGPERTTLERIAVEHEVSDRVRFEGWHEDARRYMGAFDVFVLPSRFEGFPLTVIEAMLARVPVVASRVGSVAEAVVDRQSGLLVPAEDPAALASALGSMLADPELRQRMGARGRELGLSFTSRAMARSYERLYDEILT